MSVEMIDINDLVEEVLSDLPGGDVVSASAKLREVAIEFFRASAIWTHTMPWETITANEPNVRLTSPAQSRVDRIYTARLQVDPDSQPLTIHGKSERDLTNLYGGDWLSLTGTPRYHLIIDDPLVARLVPIPDETIANALEIRVVIVPTRNAEKLPARWVERYWLVLKNGAIFKMASQKDKPYTDAGVASDAHAIWKSGLALGVADRAQGHTREPQKMMAEYPLA